MFEVLFYIIHMYTYAHTQTFLPEKHRLADRQEGEGNFNIFYQLLAGADEQLKSELLLNAQVETEESNLYIESYDDVSAPFG